MSSDVDYTLANDGDAAWIAAMSRDYIETGLGWSWHSARVARAIHDPDTIVLKARQRAHPAGFAILTLGGEEAHLQLLAVARDRRRLGIGSRLVGWLEKSVLTAGVGVVRLEVRATRLPERRFYGALGYRCIAVTPRYYNGREAAVRMAKDLWERSQTPTGR